MFIGLVFRDFAKEKRALSSWRSENKSVLPTHNPKFSGTNSFISRSYYEEKRPESGDFGMAPGSDKGYGFGRQGEKQAGLKGMPFLLKVMNMCLLTLPSHRLHPESAGGITPSLRP